MLVSATELANKNIQYSYTDGNLSVIDHIGDIQTLPYAVRLESYVVILLNEGEASFFIDGQRYEVQANNILILKPQTIFERPTLRPDTTYRIVVMSRQYVQSLLAIDGRTHWELIFYLTHNPLLEITRNEADLFRLYCDLIRQKANTPNTPHRTTATNHLMLAAFYDFHDIIRKNLNINAFKFSNAENLFCKFHEIMNNTTPKRQGVEYYAARLNVTPKYFSAICKRLTGKSAMQHITDAVLKDITRLLKDESVSIKQIAQLTGFPNQSFMGTYLKKHLGVSPFKYRETALGSPDCHPTSAGRTS